MATLWSHFDVSKEDEDKGAPRAKCKHCTSSIAYNQKSSSNLTTHLKVSVIRALISLYSLCVLASLYICSVNVWFYYDCIFCFKYNY